MFKTQKESVVRYYRLFPYPHEIFLPRNSEPRACIFLTPLLGRLVFLSDLFLERQFARTFAQNGFAAVLIHRPIFEYNAQSPLGQLAVYLTDTLIRSQAVLESVLGRHSFASLPLGTFGFSFGAVINSIWAASEPRFKSNIFGLVGANIPELFIHSKDPLMRSYRKAALKASGLTPDALLKELKKIFPRDPVEAARLIETPHNLVILALLDCIVPLRYGLLFKRNLKQCKTIYLPLGHFFSLFALPHLKRWCLHHLRQSFKE